MLYDNSDIDAAPYVSPYAVDGSVIKFTRSAGVVKAYIDGIEISPDFANTLNVPVRFFLCIVYDYSAYGIVGANEVKDIQVNVLGSNM